MAPTSEISDALAKPARHLFLSPHYDDIPLSTGATVRLLADSGRTPETIVMFGSEPDPAEPLSSFAESLHQRWGVTSDEVIATRQTEERAAAARLGATTGVLPFRDAIYREHQYRSDDDLFGSPAATEASLPDDIVAALSLGRGAEPATRVYAPLAIGRHVDHQLAFLAGRELAGRGWDVWFYEDIPYALAPGAFDTRLAQIAATGITPHASIPVAAGWQAKIDAVMSYPSQLETVFRQYVGVGTSRDEIDAALLAYATRTGVGVPAERFWRLPG
jgi:LmbE family N-acetylglucosaminyl deacetylase